VATAIWGPLDSASETLRFAVYKIKNSVTVPSTVIAYKEMG
jgi:hypothetical protein